MPVQFPKIDPNALTAIAGVELGFAQAGIKTPGRKDLLVFRLHDKANVAAVFTKNQFCAAPVEIARAHLASLKNIGKSPRALIINTGNANAGTGAQGIRDALAVCNALAAELKCDTTEILPFSTGVILENLPADKIIAAIPSAVNNLKTNNWFNAAESIMTTDTLPKACSRSLQIAGKTVHITGISKGAGMIKPNMATMLAYVATDANIPQNLLQQMIEYVANRSFNCITIDGDTSTNDSFVLIASGTGDLHLHSEKAEGYSEFMQALLDVCQQLAQMIVRDGEGATKFMTIHINGGRNHEECRLAAYAIAHSPLVKTAFFASDPNLGRILAALGRAGIDELQTEQVQMHLNDVLVVKNGQRNPAYQEADGQRVMKESEITIHIDLNRGTEQATVWTCDFSHEYVAINADYRS